MINIGQYLEKIKIEKPLIHQITNFVTANDCANAVLAMGGVTVMADEPDEVGEIVRNAKALILNMGTLSERKVKAMIIAGREANRRNIPIILDPVGSGVTSFRREAVGRLLSQIRVSVIRGNVAEIRYMLSGKYTGKGIDSLCEEDSLRIETARELAQKLSCIVAVTGETDIVSDGVKTYGVKNGCLPMGGITGTGCVCSAMIGTFCSVVPWNMLEAATCAIAYVGIAGELSWKKYGSLGMGHFHMGMFDMYGNISEETYKQEERVYEIF